MEARLTEATDRNALVLVTLPAGPIARRCAFAAALALLTSAALVAPFASMPLPGIAAFVPISQSVIFVNDLITSMLLMAQFVIVGWRAILVLAVGYLFAALLAMTQLLTFPGLFTPTGLLGAGLQTTAWLYEFWHSGLAIAVILYVLMKDQNSAAIVRESSRRAAIAASITIAIALAIAVTWITTGWEGHLPRLFTDRSTQNSYRPILQRPRVAVEHCCSPHAVVSETIHSRFVAHGRNVCVVTGYN